MPRVSTLPVAVAPGTFYTIEGGVGKRIVLGTLALQSATNVTVGQLSSTPHVRATGGVASLVPNCIAMDISAGAGRLFAQGPDTATIGTLKFGLYSSDASLAAVPMTLTSAGVTVDGVVNITSEYRVNGTKVLGARRVGWTAASGTATRTTFATGTATTVQVAERLKALIDDLIAHGTIGP